MIDACLALGRGKSARSDGTAPVVSGGRWTAGDCLVCVTMGDRNAGLGAACQRRVAGR